MTDAATKGHPGAAGVSSSAGDLETSVAVLDAKGRIVDVNDTWRRFAVANGYSHPEHGMGVDYLGACRDAVARGEASAAAVARGVEQVLAGEISTFSTVYECHGAGELRWFLLTVAPLPTGSGRGAVATHLNITRMMAAEGRLREADQRLKDYAEIASDWFWETDAEHRFRQFSFRTPSQAEIWAKGVVGRTRLERRIAEDDDDWSWACHQADLEARRVFKHFQYMMRDPNGEIRHVRTSGKPIWSDDGEFLGYRGTASDITDLVVSNRRAREAQRRLSDAVDGLSETFMLFDEDDRLVVANRAFLANNHAIVDLIKPGIAFVDILRAQIAAGIVPDALGREEAWIRDRLERHREPRGPFELHRANGRYLQVSDHRLADGASVTIATDITGIRRREERFRALLESAPDAMVIVDDKGQINNVNRMTEILTGYARNELLELHIEALIPERFRGRHHEFTTGFFAAPSARQMGEGRELFCLSKTGEEVPVEISLNAIDTEDGRLVVAGIRDISERRAAQEALRQARDELEQRVLDRTADLRAEIAERQWAEERAEAANLAKSKFLSSMSHELRTPLNAILGFAQLLDEFSEPALSDDQGDSVEQILRAGRHLLELVNEVLDLSKIDAGRIELNMVALDPRDVVGDCLVLIRALADERQITIDDATAVGGARFVGDAVRVKQVLLNVLSNAVKYNRENGRIRVATQQLDGAMLRISVTDTGIGIAADKHEEVFEPFARVGAEMTAIEGTGIGLTISRRLVEMMDGRMGLESAVGVGSTFWFELPLAETPE